MEGSSKHLSASMLYYLFDAANMHRWNDHYRTIDLTELDKQAHKAAIAWYLGKCEEDLGTEIDWERIIEHSLFALLQRIALTDLKPPVYYKLMDKNRDKLNEYVLKEFRNRVPGMPSGFMERFEKYLSEDPRSKEDDIIRAAHYLATRYEFALIEVVNSTVVDIKDTKAVIEGNVREFKGIGLAGMELPPAEDEKFQNFIKLVGQLRCQQRWARTPREPKTSVLGHCVFVAISAYLNDLDHEGVGKIQIYNDYYSGLFHDLPEVLTKDVITPVKMSSEELPEILEGIEEEMFREKVQVLVHPAWVSEFRDMALYPFEDVMPERDHMAVKACDTLAAWIEAHVSIQYGVSSKILRDAKVQTGYRLMSDKKGEKIGVAQILADFEKMTI